MTGLKVFLFLQYDFLYWMPLFCLVQRLSIFKIGISVVTISAMQVIVSDVFRLSKGPLQICSVFSLGIAPAIILLLTWM